MAKFNSIIDHFRILAGSEYAASDKEDLIQGRLSVRVIPQTGMAPLAMESLAGRQVFQILLPTPKQEFQAQDVLYWEPENRKRRRRLRVLSAADVADAGKFTEIMAEEFDAIED